MMKTKPKRIIAGAVGIAMIVVLLLFVNSFTGNPISKSIAKRVATEHIDKKYPDLDVEITRCGYNFKNSEYIAFASSHRSEDTKFTVRVNWLGNVIGDSYELDVTRRNNTFRRLNDELDTVTKSIVSYNLDYGFDFAQLSFEYKQDLSDFKLDMQLDLSNLPAPVLADFILFDADTSYERIAEIAKDVKLKMDEQRIPIEKVSIRIVPLKDKPKTENTAYSWVDSIAISDFPTSLLNEPNLAKFMEQYEKDKYIELDKEKNAEVLE